MSKNSQFEKFINKTRGSAIKEQIKQEKKLAKKERAEAIEKRFAEKRRAREGGSQEPGAGGRESGAGSRESGVGRRQPGTGGRESGAGGRESGVRGGQSGAGGRESGAGSRESGVGRRQPGTGGWESGSGTRGAAGKAAGAGKRPNTDMVQGSRAPARGTGNNKTAATREPGTEGQKTVPEMPLNKYIAHSGICSRREAAELVKSGQVAINGQVILEPGTKVLEKDLVQVKGKRIVPSKSFVYILLNKPKDYITTTDDPQGRKTVLDLLRNASNERIYPIGRLDRNTSGVLLFTNDGDLAQTLSHPKNEIKKIYEVKLDKDLTKNDFDKLLNGMTLEDGFIAPDALAYADAEDKSVIGIEIHSGRNRIVRRLFEKLGYDVRGLDRVMYAGLTKKNVQRGKWRHLSEKEVRILKHFNNTSSKNH